MSFDDKVWQYLPHRPPMLLVNHLVEVENTAAQSEVLINDEAPFFNRKSKIIPAWVGIEYMGQTAALIAGYQLEQGTTGPHLGFLLGTRNYSTTVPHFKENSKLLVKCSEKAVVGEGLATFDCAIYIDNEQEPAATASLSVFRRPIED